MQFNVILIFFRIKTEYLYTESFDGGGGDKWKTCHTLFFPRPKIIVLMLTKTKYWKIVQYFIETYYNFSFEQFKYHKLFT